MCPHYKHIFLDHNTVEIENKLQKVTELVSNACTIHDLRYREFYRSSNLKLYEMLLYYQAQLIQPLPCYLNLSRKDEVISF